MENPLRGPKIQPPVIVTDGLWRKSLSAIRALGKSGYSVTVLGDSFWTTGFWSRFTRRRIFFPPSAREPEKFLRALQKLGARYESSVDSHLPLRLPPILFPMEDSTLKIVSKNRDELSKYFRFLIPSEESLAAAWDKSQTLAHAEKLGLPCPRTLRPQSELDFVSTVSNPEFEFGLNWVTKPCDGSGSSGVHYGNFENEIQAREHWKKFGPLVIQERIPAEGRGLGVSALFDRSGNCVASFTHERLQQYPNSGGPSTDRVSIESPEIEKWSLELLKSLKWKGVAMVEWKWDPRDSQPKLMEINPRFWGSLELAVRAGVNFPTLYADACSDQPIAKPVVRLGVRCRWLVPGDILRFFSQPSTKSEGLGKFLKGLPFQAEEWDSRDWPGFFATWICTLALALNPRYWKYLRRG